MIEYKVKWQEAQRDLQAQLNTTKKVSKFLPFAFDVLQVNIHMAEFLKWTSIT